MADTRETGARSAADGHAGRTPPRFGRADALAVALLTGLVVALLWRVVLLGEVLLPLDVTWHVQPWASEAESPFSGPVWNVSVGDAVTQQHPAAVSSWRGWGHGPPLWQSTVLAGTPALATGQAYSSPVIVALSRLVSVERALGLATFVHLLIGAVGCYLLLRELGCRAFGSLLGAVVFSLNLYLAGWLSQATMVGSWVWIPLVFLGFEAALGRRDLRWALLGGVALAAQVLSGYPLWPLYTALALALYTGALTVVECCRARSPRPAARPLASGAVIGAVGVALSAPVLLLRVEMLPRTLRLGDIFAGVFLPAAETARLLVPQLWGDQRWGQPFSGFYTAVETTCYIGIVPLLVIAASPWVRRGARQLIFFLVGLLFFLAPFGLPPATQIVGWLSPVFLEAFPGRVFYVTCFTWAVAVGLGADWLDRKRPARLLRGLGAAAVALSLVLVALLVRVKLRWLPGMLAGIGVQSTLGDPATAAGRGVLLAVVWLLLGGGLLWLWSGRRDRRWVPAALVGVTALDLLVLGVGVTPSFPAARMVPETPSLAALRELTQAEEQPVRFVGIPTREILPGQMPEVWSLQAPTGYTSWMLSRYAQYTRLIPHESDWEIQVYFDDCCHPLLDALNVMYVYAAEGWTPSSAGRTQLDSLLVASARRAVVDGPLRATRWPVEGVGRPAMVASGPATAEFRLDLPDDARFTAGLGLDPGSFECSDGVTFEVSVVASDDADPHVLLSLWLDPRDNPDHRAFVPVDVDLTSVAGSDVTVKLAIGPGPAGDATCDTAAWLEPAVVSESSSTLDLVHDGPNRVYRNRNALPRAWLVRRVIEVEPGNLELVSRCLASRTFEPAVEAVVEGRVGSRLGTPQPDDRVVVVDHAAQRVELEVHNAEPALLVMSDMVYPGWRATVDGVEQPILATNMVMRGVVVGAGTHRVVLEYRPRLAVVGMWVSVVVAGTSVVMVVASTRRRRRDRQLSSP